MSRKENMLSMLGLQRGSEGACHVVAANRMRAVLSHGSQSSRHSLARTVMAADDLQSACAAACAFRVARKSFILNVSQPNRHRRSILPEFSSLQFKEVCLRARDSPYALHPFSRGEGGVRGVSSSFPIYIPAVVRNGTP